MTNPDWDVIRYQGEQYRLIAHLLNEFFETQYPEIGFQWMSTANWGNAVGSWEIKENKLYLIELEGKVNGNEVTIKDFGDIFPQVPIFAEWVSKEVFMKRLVFVGEFPVQYKTLFIYLTIQKGMVTETKRNEVIMNYPGYKSPST
jgi:hypothetical protein